MIVVVAILAALSYVGYTTISDRAHDSVVRSDLAHFAKAAQLFRAENGVYPSTLQLVDLELSATKLSYDTIGYNLYYCTDAPVNGGSYSKFGFAAKSKSGNNFYASSSGNGTSGRSAMFASHACSPIDVQEVSHNLTFAYNHNTGIWVSWAN